MTLVVNIENEEEKLKFKQVIHSYSFTIQQLIEGYKRFNLELDETYINNAPPTILIIIKNSKLLTQELLIFLKKKENQEYFFLTVGKQTLGKRLDQLSIDIFHLNKRPQTANRLLTGYSRALSSFANWFNFYIDSVNEKKQSNQLIESLRSKVAEATIQAKNFETAIQAINGEESEKIYSSASINFVDSARKYEVLFYLILGGAVLFTTVHLCYVPFKGNEVNFILVKILTFSLVLTLGTLFLRKAAHLRKLSDQAQQTSLELKALPLYLKNVDKEHHSEIYKELAGKYFGKDVDQTQNDKIGDLMKDQLAAGTELIKASAEMVKVKNDSKATSTE